MSPFRSGVLGAFTWCLAFLVRVCFRSRLRKMPWAWAVLENGRRCQNLRRLSRAFRVVALQVATDRCDLARIFPLLGLFRGLRERGVSFPPSSLGYFDMLENWVRSDSTRPGWNDYYMALFFVTGDSRYVSTIYARACENLATVTDERWAMVIISARWMVDSVRRRHRDFDGALKELEATGGDVPAPTFFGGAGLQVS